MQSFNTPVATSDLTPKSYVDTRALTAMGAGPLAHSALAWTCDPCMTANAIPATGRFSATRFRAAVTGTANNIIVGVTTAGATVTAVYGAIFDLAGNQLGITTVQSTTFQSTGDKTLVLVAGVSLVLGTEYVFVFLQVATTGATLNGTIGTSRPNMGMTITTTNPRRQGISTATAQTTIPSTLVWTAFGDVGNAPCALMTV